jgi:aminoglycoside phosphotransferase (APT) family kinase protein
MSDRSRDPSRPAVSADARPGVGAPSFVPLTTAAELLAAAAAQGLALSSPGRELEQTGLDFLVLLAHDAGGRPWVVRTPRRADVVEAAAREARVLRALAGRLPVAVPDWQVHALDVIAYPRLPGVPAVEVVDGAPVWNVDLAALPDALLDGIAQALVALQSVDESRDGAGLVVKPVDASREEVARAMRDTREVLGVSDALWARWQRWLGDDACWPAHRALVHGDLHPGHLLLDEQKQLTGILDWTEACFTDPGVDFAMLGGCLGAPALAAIVERFARAGGRTWPRLLDHAAERWLAFPALGAAWALRTGNETALTFARAQVEQNAAGLQRKPAIVPLAAAAGEGAQIYPA